MKRIFLTISILTLTVTLLFAQNTREQLAIQYYQNGQFEEAASIFESLYQQRPTAYYYNYYINSLIGAQDFETAERFLRRRIRQERDNVRLKIDLGFIYQNLGDARRAQRQYDDVLNNLPANERAVRDAANGFIMRRENEYAIQTYIKGRHILRNENLFRYELANIYDRIHDHEKMVNEYLELLASNPQTHMRNVQNRLQHSLSRDPDGNKSEALRIALLKRVQRNPSATYYAEMLLWHSVQQRDFKTAFTQARALDRRHREDGKRVYDLGNLALSNNAYDVAADCFTYVLEKGEDNYYYLNARVKLLHTRYSQIINNYDFTIEDLRQIEVKYEDMLEAYGVNHRTVPLIKDLAHIRAFYLDKGKEAIDLLNTLVDMPQIPEGLAAEAKILLGDILLLNGDVWDATLIYSQVEKDLKHEPVGHEAKFKNARLSFYINEFDWAKAQLDVLKASTSKLIANDALALSLLISDNIAEDNSYDPLSMYARAELLAFQNKHYEALDLLDSIERRYFYHVIMDNVLFKKAEIFKNIQNHKAADSLYKRIVDYYPKSVLADDALFLRAQLYENIFEDKEKAMQLYQSILTKFPGSLHVVDARRRFRILRGDIVN